MSDSSSSPTSMKEDEGGEMKRKNDDSDALLPTQETQESTNNQEEGQQADDVQMQDVAFASPNKVDDDAAKMNALKQIMDNNLTAHTNDRVRTKWDELVPLLQQDRLKQVISVCNDSTNKGSFVGEVRGIFRSIFEEDKQILESFIAGVYEECVRARLIVEGKKSSDRVVSITHGLDQKFLGAFDMEELDTKVQKVLKWHTTDYTKYRSPSFAMLQSSGMGKTKLMLEYKKRHSNVNSSDIECKMILCMGETPDKPQDFEKHYDVMLQVAGHQTFETQHADAINEQLERITCTKNKVIFFFDEAQNLLPAESTGPYHTVLWWLRRKRKKSYVGVFAGTLLGLSSFQVLHAQSKVSRDPKQAYKNYNNTKKDREKKWLLYDPFFSLTTISVLRSQNIKNNVVDDLGDIGKYGCNGRPLFAAMLRRQGPALAPELTLSDMDCHNGDITNATMYNILLRLLLSDASDEWASNDDSIASVLGTRVQLGLANYDFVNKATSSGYAMLVRYDTPESDRQDQIKNFGSVAIVFPPDPVCAALAMGMMQQGWAVKKGVGDALIKGREPNFWVDKMARLFDQHVFLPNRGDAGEVFAALYMLLCGDALRSQEDQYMRHFEVDLQKWLLELLKEIPENPERPKEPEPSMEQEKAEVRRSPRLNAADDMAQETMDTDMEKVEESMTSLVSTTNCKLTLNFIQVCRNYFRSHAWFDQSMLAYMNDTATGCYVYPLCPAIDIVFPIKKVNVKDEISYHPCLVSVKCWDSIDLSKMKNAMTRMRDYLKDHRPKGDNSTPALCLLIAIGTCCIPAKLPESEGSFPTQDTFITIVVPSRDQFEVNNAIQNIAGASHISELLASHSFAFAEKNDTALRLTATEHYRDLGKRLLADKQKLREGKLREG